MTAAFQIAGLAALAMVGVSSLMWVGFDARRRGRSSMRIVFLCVLTWPLGFLIWHGVRPPPAIR